MSVMHPQRFGLVLLATLLSQNLAAQFIEEEKGDYLDSKFVDEHFEGGHQAYVKFFQDSLVFPRQSYKAQREGLLLFYFEVTPGKQEIDLTFLTHLDDYIEKEVRQTVNKTRGLWKLSGPGPYRFYQPIVYSLLPYYPDVVEGGIPLLPGELPSKFLQMLAFIKSRRLTPDYDIGKVVDKNNVRESDKKVYLRAYKQYTKMTELEELDAAYDALNVLIRFNPFNRNFLLDRIALEKKMGLRKYQAYDARLLQDFVDELTPVTPVDPDENLFTRFIGGKDAYYNYINEHIRYPEYSIQMKSQGVVMVSYSVAPDGSHKVNFLTTLDSQIEAHLKEILSSLEVSWKATGTDYVVYQPFYFSLKEPYHEQFYQWGMGFPQSFADPILEPVIVNMGIDDEGLGALQVYMDNLDLYEQAISKNKVKKIGAPLNELIKIDPFNAEFIEKRIELANRGGDRRFLNQDYAWLNTLKALRKSIK